MDNNLSPTPLLSLPQSKWALVTPFSTSASTSNDHLLICTPPPRRPFCAMAAHTLLSTAPLSHLSAGAISCPGPRHLLVVAASRKPVAALSGRSDVEVAATQTRRDDVSRRNWITFVASSLFFSQAYPDAFLKAETSSGFREFVNSFDGYTFIYPQNWIQVRGAGVDVFFRDPFVLDENMSLEISSPSSSRYKSVEDLGSAEEAGKKVLRQYLTEFMSTRLGVRRESKILSTSSKVADDGKLYYQVEINIKSFANNNELAVMPQDRVVRLEWDRRYLSVLGVVNSRLYELRLQAPERVFSEEEDDLRRVMDSFRVLEV